MKLYLKFSKHKHKIIETTKYDTFYDLQNKLKEIDHDILRPESIIFVWNGKRILDTEINKTLEEFKVIDDSTIAVFINKHKNKNQQLLGTNPSNITSILNSIQQTLTGTLGSTTNNTTTHLDTTDATINNLPMSSTSFGELSLPNISSNILLSDLSGLSNIENLTNMPNLSEIANITMNISSNTIPYSDNSTSIEVSIDNLDSNDIQSQTLYTNAPYNTTNLNNDGQENHDNNNASHDESNDSNDSNDSHDDSDASHDDSNASNASNDDSNASNASNASHDESNDSNDDSNTSNESNDSHDDSNASNDDSNASNDDSNASNDDSNDSNDSNGSNESHDDSNASNESNESNDSNEQVDIINSIINDTYNIDKNIDILVQMGYTDQNTNRFVLEQTQNNLESALLLLNDLR